MDWIDIEYNPRSSESPVRQACFDSELDWLPEDATDAQVIDRVSQEIIGKIRSYKSARGARQMLVARLNLLRLIADQEPDIFDAILLEYAEHVTTVK